MTNSQQFLTYVNGRLMPHSQALPLLRRVNERAVGGYYDSARTFGGRPFRLRRHLERLFGGLAYSRIDPGITIDDMERASLGVVAANLELLGPGPADMVVTQTVTITRPESADDLPGVDVAIYCVPLDFAAFARGYADGVRLFTPTTHPMPAGVGDGKTGSALTLALMVNRAGHITECQGANFMFVMDGTIMLPDRRNVLPGVSMGTILELATAMGIPVAEGLFSPSLIYAADEAFVSSTRYCMLPVASLNDRRIGRAVPGPVTESILTAWKDMVGMDFVEQALRAVD